MTASADRRHRKHRPPAKKARQVPKTAMIQQTKYSRDSKPRLCVRCAYWYLVYSPAKWCLKNIVDALMSCECFHAASRYLISFFFRVAAHLCNPCGHSCCGECAQSWISQNVRYSILGQVRILWALYYYRKRLQHVQCAALRCQRSNHFFPIIPLMP